VRVNRRAFLQGAAGAAGATLTAAACGGSQNNCDSSSNSGGNCAPGIPGSAYFSQLSLDLAAAGIGTPQMLIDLDRLDANADAISTGIGGNRYRIVEKSLPSLDVLGYVSTRTGSNRFLVMHLPFLPAILNAFPSAEVLVGKCQPIAAVNQFFQTFAPADWPGVAQHVRFLADTPARISELLALASSLSLTLQVGVEIDVGLHRGGVRQPSGLPAVLSAFLANPTLVTFAGMLGYDGHVANAPSAPGLDKPAALATYKAAQATYQSFVNVLQSQFGSLWRNDLVFNSGSTSTYPLYQSGPVNDVAAGGGMLRPSSYPNTFIGALSPASFIAAPVLAHFDTVELPIVNGLSQTVWSGQQGFTMYGGGWAADFVYPDGVDLAPLVNDPLNQNLVPNQCWMVGPSSPAILPGDWIFQHPFEADAIFQFENLLLVRGGRLQPNTWRAFPRRY
jgi:D-serine deaminase-like pyridoxal phosphate-dependent protein